MPEVATSPPIHSPRLAGDGEPCPTCGALMASDQRYCLSCGTRRGATRVPFPPQRAAAPAAAAPRPLPRERFYDRYSPQLVGIVSGIAAAAVLGLGMIAGTLIAKQGDDNTAVAAAPVAATATATPPPAATASATAAATDTFTADWPAEQTGWTIQLQTLPKDGTTPGAVAQAKSDASAKGVADVGALDSDAFASLDSGNYVIYSGNYADKQSAEAALGGVTGSFADAKVVQVGAKSADDTGGDSGSGSSDSGSSDSGDEPPAAATAAPKTPDQAQKDTKNAPPKVKTEGTPAPKDDKKPGGDSPDDAVTIG
jgi:hypothetical protein